MIRYEKRNEILQTESLSLLKGVYIYMWTFISLLFEVNILREKWGNGFDFADVNNDSVLDMADVELCKDNYLRLHNLTAEEVCHMSTDIDKNRADAA